MITNFPIQPVFNIAGYSDFQFAPYYTVAVFPAAINKMISDPIQFQAPHVFLNGYATMDTLDFSEECKKTSQGPIYEQLISGFVPGDTDELATLMEFMEGSSMKYVVTMTPLNGKRRLIGLTAPLDFSAELVPGKAPGERKGYEFKFSAISTVRAFFYNV